MRYVQDQARNLNHQFAEVVGVDSAGAGSWKAPSCDTDGSVVSAWPVVGRGAPLEWDTYPTAGVGQKLSQGFGDRVPDVSALRAGGLSSLDLITNNRNKVLRDFEVRPVGRGKYCGRMCVCGMDPKTGHKIYRRVNCGSWGCSYCGPRKARTAKASIRRVAEDLGLRYFLTLTLDPKKLLEMEDKREAVLYLRVCFNKFRIYLKRLYGTAPSYICVLEFTQKGIPHLHILFDRYISQQWISSTWDRLGGGRIVFIKQVTVANVSRYLSKYLTKELLLSAPKGTRRITTARAIHLFPKFDSGISWELLKESIWSALTAARMMNFEFQADLFHFIVLGFDEEKYLNKFEIVIQC
jgi:hypothetical protein